MVPGRRRLLLGSALAAVSVCAAMGGAPASAEPAGTGSSAPARVAPVVVAAGDISDDQLSGQVLTSELVSQLAPRRVLTLGDNQYDAGAYADFVDFYDPTWGTVKDRTWPAPGNHEYLTPGAAGYFEYFGAAARPEGVSYYSHDIGRWHVVSLDSNIPRGARSAQLSWLRADLAASSQPCVVAYWHHPRFSSGAHHGSDPTVGPFWTALYGAGADLVLNGHEHVYERFARQDPAGQRTPAGIREFIVGTGGADLLDFGTPLANSQARVAGEYGVLRLVLSPASYTWEFVTVGGEVLDSGGRVRCH